MSQELEPLAPAKRGLSLRLGPADNRVVVIGRPRGAAGNPAHKHSGSPPKPQLTITAERNTSSG